MAFFASNGCVPDFFQLILKIYIKNDFLTPYQGDFIHRHMVFLALVFSANFVKIAAKCKQTAEKTNLLHICGSYECGHWFQCEFWRSETVATAKKW